MSESRTRPALSHTPVLSVAEVEQIARYCALGVAGVMALGLAYLMA